MNIIDSFFVALGFDVDQKGLKDLERQTDAAKDRILSIGTFLTGALTGLVAKQIATIGSQFESNRIQIAGFFTALGQSPDFETALSAADQTLDMISAAAAKLPGEAEEYQEVFMNTFSFVKTAVGGSIEQMTDFTNQLTAIGKAGQLPAAQIARETMELLADEGRATNINRLWIQLLPLLKRVQGQAKLTKEQFNAMTAPQRAELMRKAFAGLKPMLDAAANSFDAMWGAAISGAKKLTRLGTQGLFEGMKVGLSQLVGIFFDANFNLTETGKTAVAAIHKVSKVITTLVTDAAGVVMWFAKSRYGATLLKVALGFLAAQLTALTFAKVAGTIETMVKGIFNLRRALTGGAIAAIALIAEDLYQFYTGGLSVTGMLVKKWPAALHVIQVGLGLLAAALVRTQVIAAFRLARIALGLGLLHAPILVIIGALALLAAGIYYVVTRWETFSPRMKAAIGFVGLALAALTAAFIATKAAAIATAVQMAIAWAAAFWPVTLGVVALGLVALAIYELWKHWEAVSGFIKDNWVALVPILFTPLGPLLAIITAIVAVGKNFDAVIEKMKDSWNSFAETVNSVGIVNLPTFKYSPMLPAGEGVALPNEGPKQLAYQQAYTGGYIPGAPFPAAPPEQEPTGPYAKYKKADAAAVAAARARPGLMLEELQRRMGVGAGGGTDGAPSVASAAAPSASYGGPPVYTIPGSSPAAAPAPNQTTVRVDKVEIKTNDPMKMGREFERQVIRAGQSKVGL